MMMKIWEHNIRALYDYIFKFLEYIEVGQSQNVDINKCETRKLYMETIENSI